MIVPELCPDDGLQEQLPEHVTVASLVLVLLPAHALTAPECMHTLRILWLAKSATSAELPSGVTARAQGLLNLAESEAPSWYPLFDAFPATVLTR